MKIIESLFRKDKSGSVKDFSSHWDKAYSGKNDNKLGWYEKTPEPSLKLIEKYLPDVGSSILNVGAGATTLIDHLIDRGYCNIIVNDLSRKALEVLKTRLGEKGDQINWIVDDLVNPSKLDKIGTVKLWHDRAVLHFFNNFEDQKRYFKLLNKTVKPGGFAMISVFSPGGAVKCSGLKITPYNSEMIAEKIGSDFKLIEEFNYIYTMPSGGKRDYIYTVFKRAE